MAGQVLTVTDWERTASVNDRLLFAGLASSFTSAHAQSDVAFDGTPGYGVAQYNGYFQVYAAPEPTSLLLVGVGAAPLVSRRQARRG